MASITDLRSELESGDASHQTQALIVLLNHLSTERDVGGLPSLVCQKVIASGDTPPPVRRLAYDVVRLATLSRADWDAICASLKADLSGQVHPETAATALLLVPSIPPAHLVRLVTREDFGPALAGCLRSDSGEVRSMAVDALSAALGSGEMMEAICSSPGIVSSALEWWAALGNALLDSDDEVSSSAYSALRLLFQAEREGDHNTDGRQLRRQLVQNLTQRLLCGLTPLLQRTAMLPLAAQPPALQLLVLVLHVLSDAVIGKGGAGEGWGAEAPSAAGGAGISLFGAASPGEVAPSGALLAWASQEVGRFLLGQMAMPDPGVMVEAARGLMQVACLPAPDLLQASASEDPSAAFVAGTPPPAEWAASAVTCLLSLWGRPDALVARHDIILTCCAGLSALEPQRRAVAVRNLLQLSCSLLQARHRVEAFSQLWHAAVELDLGARRAAWGHRYPPPSLLLSAVFEDSAVECAVRAPAVGPASPQKDAGGPAARPGPQGEKEGTGAAPPPPGVGPEAREEMVATALLTLLQHQQSAKMSAAVDSSLNEESVYEAARRQHYAEALDWVRASLVALHALSPVLGWDVAPTMLPDLWLHLLQHCAAATAALVQQGPAPSRNSMMRRRQRTSSKSPASASPQPATGTVEDASEELEAVQALLSKVMSELSGMRAALRPRALWVLVHHLNLHPEETSTWTALVTQLQAMADEAVLDRERSNRLAMASAQGVLALAEGGRATVSSPTGASGGGAAALQTLVLCLERMAGLLSLAQYAEETEENEEENGGALLSTLDDDEQSAYIPRAAKLVRKALERLLGCGSALGPDVTDICHRIQRQLVALQGDSRSANAGDSLTQDLAVDVGGFGVFREEDLAVAEGYPFGNAPQQSASGVRAARLDEMVRSAVAKVAAASSRSHSSESSPDLDLHEALVDEGLWTLGVPAQGAHQSGTPSASELLASLGGRLPSSVPGAAAAEAVSASAHRRAAAGQSAAWQQLTGASDPVQLMGRHVANPSANTVTLHLKITNLLPHDTLESIVVNLGLLGPLHPVSRQPTIAWRPATLVPQESQEWETQVWVSSFARCQVQPRMQLARGRRDGQLLDLSVRCRPYTIPLTHLLKGPSMEVKAAALFQRWEGLPAQWEGRAFAHSPGVGQAPALLSALENCTPFQRVWLRGLPSLGGFQAAYQAATWTGDTVAVIFVTQLLPTDDQTTSPAQPSLLDSGRLAVRLSVRASSQTIAHSIQASPAAWVADISGGLLSHGTAPPPPSRPLLPTGPRMPSSEPTPPSTSPLSMARRGMSGRSTPAAASTTDLLSDYGDEGGGGGSGGEGGAALQEAVIQEWRRLNMQPPQTVAH